MSNTDEQQNAFIRRFGRTYACCSFVARCTSHLGFLLGCFFKYAAKLPSLWQETPVFSENSHLTERAAVKIA